MDSVIIFCAQYLFLFVIAGIGIACLQTTKNLKAQFIAAIIIAGAIAFILSRIASKLYYDPRPFVTEHVRPLISHPADNGFPSDHALLTMTLTAITYFYNKKIAFIMLCLTILVGISRVLAKVHSPVDIGGGWIFGAIGAIAGYYLTLWLFKNYIHNANKDS